MPHTVPINTEVVSGEYFLCNKGWAKPLQPNSSSVPINNLSNSNEGRVAITSSLIKDSDKFPLISDPAIKTRGVPAKINIHQLIGALHRSALDKNFFTPFSLK